MLFSGRSHFCFSCVAASFPVQQSLLSVPSITLINSGSFHYVSGKLASRTMAAVVSHLTHHDVLAD